MLRERTMGGVIQRDNIVATHNYQVLLLPFCVAGATKEFWLINYLLYNKKRLMQKCLAINTVSGRFYILKEVLMRSYQQWAFKRWSVFKLRIYFQRMCKTLSNSNMHEIEISLDRKYRTDWSFEKSQTNRHSEWLIKRLLSIWVKEMKLELVFNKTLEAWPNEGWRDSVWFCLAPDFTQKPLTRALTSYFHRFYFKNTLRSRLNFFHALINFFLLIFVLDSLMKCDNLYLLRIIICKKI